MKPLKIFQENRALSDQISRLPKPELSPDRRQAMRLAVIHAAKAQPTESTVSSRPEFRLGRLSITIITAAIVIFVGASTAVTAQAARPGDALYGLDRALDQLHLHVAIGAQARASVAANIAEERQAELDQIQQQSVVNVQNETEAQADANVALDRAIEAVGKITTKSVKNRAAIASRAAAKVQHLIEIRVRQQAKKAQQELKHPDAKESPPGPPGVSSEDTPSSSGQGGQETDQNELTPTAPAVKTQSTGRIKVESRLPLVPNRQRSTQSGWATSSLVLNLERFHPGLMAGVSATATVGISSQ